MDARRWQEVSPLLDELLELDAAQREERLRALRERDARLADELRRLLAPERSERHFIDAPLLDHVPAARPGQVIGGHVLLRLLGEGGMGAVWLAQRGDDASTENHVALKLLRPGLADTGLRTRFARERDILARLQHPHIARLRDAGVDGEQPWLALDYVDGAPITDYCAQHALDVDARLQLFLQVCAALTHAHANLVVHRDLKPSNILVDAHGDAQVIDFGIAKLLHGDAHDATATQTRVFTPRHAAPEQIRGEPVTTMTDVHALGAVLYELLSGAHPFNGGNAIDVENAILNTEPLRPSQAVRRGNLTHTAPEARRLARRLRGDLDNIVMKALEKQPQQRYLSVEAFARDVRRHLDGLPVQARAQGLGYRLRKYVRRNRWPIVAGSTIAATLVLATAFSLHKAHQEQEARKRSEAVLAFVQNLFAGNEAEGGYGTRLTAVQLLDRAGARVDAAFPDDPVGKAQLLGVVARTYADMGLYKQAEDFGRRATTAALPFRAQEPSLYLRNLQYYANAMQNAGFGGAELEALITRDLDFARAHDRGAASWLLSLRGQSRRYTKNLPGAEADLREALALAEAEPTPSPKLQADINTLLALVLADRGQHQEALQRLETARNQLQASPDTQPLDLLTNDYNRASALQRLNQFARSAALLETSLPRWQALAGPMHPGTLRTRSLLALEYARQGRYAQALQMTEDNLRLLRQSPGAGDAFSLHLSEQADARLLILSGRAADALPLLHSALEFWRDDLIGRTRPRGLLGEALLQLDRCNEAEPELHVALDDAASAIASGNASFTSLSGMALDSLARCRLLQGDAANAQRLLAESAARLSANPHADPNDLLRNRIHQLWAARVAGDAHADAELRALRPQLAAALDNPRHPVLAQFDQLLAALPRQPLPAGFHGLNAF